ncbi:Phosphoribosylformimino-5-aminoimidazole carboxamide ribotide isomerase [Lojkania enalia]|uniref:1-(5-phosphoribosyl)-5-[(5-phosphoribosylamino)methylideneamino] imidazole-4-carboxamide isomerase n=1 Tax=Lojkania enalia TaxID=147567 RepID=A0A9P4K311_9PLEO|nr:Phosphoribosylformimino-5-aminoimidazole carboxamide ribotide isomerase [Didymosphaeria enalia]
MTRFRPCIDLHAGSVKQIVGGTLSTTLDSSLKTNFTSEHPSTYYANLYKKHDLTGAHVIMLGPGNEEAAQEALAAWKGGMQVGGGITEKNAAEWIARGADKVIITSYLFPDSVFSLERLQAVLHALDNDKQKLVIDLSCRRKDGKWFVATNKWQTMTDFELSQVESIKLLEPHCSEFLIHAADVEGLQRGIDHELVSKLAEWCSLPVTYAGGGRSIEDLGLVEELSKGAIDLTIGSALDIFGGSGVKFEDCVEWNKAQWTK